MLDLLDIVPDGQKSKHSQKQVSSYEQFNQIMLRLKQRNIHNESFIKKYIKQASRKKNKLAQILAYHIQCQLQNGGLYVQDYKSPKSINSSKFHKPAQLEVSSKITSEEKVSNLEFKHKNDTQETIDEECKASSLPIINYLLNSKQDAQSSSKNKAHGPFKQSIDSNKYIRNRCFKEYALNKRIPMKKEQQAYKSSEFHIKNQTKKWKKQLNIRNFIFGSQDIVSHKKVETENVQKTHLNSNDSERFKNIKKYQINDEIQDNKQKMKALFPAIKYQSPKLNRKYFISHIRNNAQRLTIDQMEIFKVCQINYETLTSKYQKGRNISSFKINTLEIKSRFD